MIILVVVYGKEFHDSLSLQSLEKNYPLLKKKPKLVIWNNGPKKLNFHDISEDFKTRFNVELIQTIDNISLSVIYNKVISCYSKEKKFMFLDDDTSLTEEYFIRANEVRSNQMGIPIICANGVIKSPILDGCTLNKKVDIKHTKNIYAIMSGIVIGRDVINTIRDKFPKAFDENFVLYGVDTSFFKRFNKVDKINSVRILPLLSHSLSRENSVEHFSDFRQKERGASEGLLCRYYSSKKGVVKQLIHMSLKVIACWYYNKQNVYNIEFLKSLITGCHYRNFNVKNVFFSIKSKDKNDS